MIWSGFRPLAIGPVLQRLHGHRHPALASPLSTAGIIFVVVVHADRIASEDAWVLECIDIDHGVAALAILHDGPDIDATALADQEFGGLEGKAVT